MCHVSLDSLSFKGTVGKSKSAGSLVIVRTSLLWKRKQSMSIVKSNSKETVPKAFRMLYFLYTTVQLHSIEQTFLFVLFLKHLSVLFDLIYYW